MLIRRRLQEQFISFKTTHMSERCSDQQVRDMEIAFMAGCAAMYRTVVTGLTSRDVITPQDVNMIKDIIKELEVFTKEFAPERKM